MIKNTSLCTRNYLLVFAPTRIFASAAHTLDCANTLHQNDKVIKASNKPNPTKSSFIHKDRQRKNWREILYVCNVCSFTRTKWSVARAAVYSLMLCHYHYRWLWFLRTILISLYFVVFFFSSISTVMRYLDSDTSHCKAQPTNSILCIFLVCLVQLTERFWWTTWGRHTILSFS